MSIFLADKLEAGINTCCTHAKRHLFIANPSPIKLRLLTHSIIWSLRRYLAFQIFRYYWSQQIWVLLEGCGISAGNNRDIAFPLQAQTRKGRKSDVMMACIHTSSRLSHSLGNDAFFNQMFKNVLYKTHVIPLTRFITFFSFLMLISSLELFIFKNSTAK